MATAAPGGRGRAPATSGGVLRLAGLLFASGAAALVYQVLWVKQLSLVVGIEVYAVTTAVAAFFAGLALGGVLFGRRVDRTARPLRLCALLELGIAVLGVLATLALGQAAPLFAAAEDRVGALAWALPFFLVGAPAVLMGGTLPVLVRAQAPGPGQVGRAGGGLSGEQEQWASALEHVLQGDGENRYYRWFVGGGG